MQVGFCLLGGLRVAIEGEEIALAGARQRALLARLLLVRNEIAPWGRLVDDLYPGSRNGQKALQVGVARLRRSLGPTVGGRLMTREAGYELQTQLGEVDVELFEAELARGLTSLRSGNAAAARDAAARGLALWRGTPFGELAGEPWARGETARLEELRLQALELHTDAELDLGAAETVIADLERLVVRHPAREGLRERLMLALYRAGRQADALAAYRDLRHHLVDAHGIEPGLELRELQRAILLQDPSLTAARPVDLRGPAPAAPVAPTHLTAPALLAGAQGTPFVGRVAERAALETAIETCRAGERVAALLSGEPGIGKTRLAAEVAAHAQRLGFEVLSGRCDDDLAIPFKPFVEALEILLSGEADADLRTHVRKHGAVLAHLLPGHLGQSDDDAPAGTEGRESHAEGQQYALFAAIASLLLQASRRRPLLMVLEDLHWADRPTMLLMKHLLTFPAQMRLMVIGSYRASELQQDHPLKDLLADLHREGSVMRLELVGLLDGEVGELAGALSAHREALAPAAARALRRSTAGNPFLVTEMTRALVDAGRDPGDLLSEEGLVRDETLPLPLSIRETVSRRVDRLPGDAATFLAAASVLGVTFDPELVVSLAERPGADALSALEAALSAGLLEDGNDRMSFRHALIAQTLYETLSAARRRELHRRAAETMVSKRGSARSPAGPAAIARHYLRAGAAVDRERALEWTLQAARDALAKLAPQEAQRWLQEALALVKDGATDDDERMRCEVLVELGEAQRQSGDPAYRETLLQAARLADTRSEDDALVRAALANTRGFVSGTGSVDDERIAVLEEALATVGPAHSATRARLLATLAGELSYAGDLDRRTQLSDEALQIARGLGDQKTLVDVIGPRNVTLWVPETLEERLQNTAECMRAADLLDDPLAQFQAAHWRASTCIESGAFAEAATCRVRARRLAERLRQPTALWMSSYDAANEALFAGRLAECERLANEAFAIGQRSGQPDALLILASQIMVIRYEQGRLGECVDLVAQSLDQNPALTGFRAVLALGHCEERHYEEAAALLLADAKDGFASLAYDLTWLPVLCAYAHVASRLAAAGQPHPQVLGRLCEVLEPWHEQIAYTGAGGWGIAGHYLGMARLAAGRADDAVRVLEDAMIRAERMPAPIWAARSRLELARALRACERHGEAHALLRRVRREAETLGCAGIAREAGELISGAALTS